VSVPTCWSVTMNSLSHPSHPSHRNFNIVSISISFILRTPGCLVWSGRPGWNPAGSESGSATTTLPADALVVVAGACHSGPPGGPGPQPRLFVRFGVLFAIRPRFAGALFLEGADRVLPGILPRGPQQPVPQPGPRCFGGTDADCDPCRSVVRRFHGRYCKNFGIGIISLIDVYI